MPDFLTTPTFIIGLGGIGQEVTFLIADRFQNSRWGMVPPTIRIRSFDTAAEEPYEIPTSRYRRFTRLGQFDANQVIQHLHLYPQINSWWDYQLTPGFISAGAHAERPVGRLVFYRDIATIYNILSEDFTAPLTDDLQRQLVEAGLGQVSRQPLVFIIGSLAGGTCSGMLIDMALLIRRLLTQMGYESGGINITAVIGLESVINVSTHDPISEAAKRRQLNVNAAIREIDFLQGWPERFSLTYPQPLGQFEPTPPLFNQAYLFTARKMGGFFFQDRRDILTRVAHFIFGQIASKAGEVARSIMDNRTEFFNPDTRMVGDGLRAIYGAFGVEWLEVPKQKLRVAWCQNHAELLGKLIVEFDWANEPREDLLRTFRELLSSDLHGYRRALDLLALEPQRVLSEPAFSALSLKLETIQNARKKKEIEAALYDFENDLPNLVPPIIRREVPLAAEAAREDVWLLEMIQSLFRDRRFRLGGARRVLTEAAEHLRRLSAPLDLAISSNRDVVEQSCNFLGRVKDFGPGLEWAQKKTFQAVKVALQNVIGNRADALAKKMDESANGIQRLQEDIRDLVQKLKHIQLPGDTVPQDAWLLNPEDIQGLLDEQPEDIARHGADEIAARLAAETSLNVLRTYQKGFLDKNLSYWIESSLEKALQTRIRRPVDNVQRIKHRMTQCEPLARIITDGPEFHKVMQDSQKSTPLKIVLTGLSDQDREELQQWAREENLRLGGVKMYEIFPTAEELRDDILHLTFGWPFWLFDEIRTGEELLERAKEQDPRRYQNSFLLLKQIPAIRDHQIKPLPERDARQWFGLALALHDIDFMAQEIVFQAERFSGIVPVEGETIGERLEKAFDLFRQQGLAPKYKIFIKREENQDIAGFKNRLLEGVATRRQALQNAYESGQLPKEVHDKLYDFYQLAQKYAEGIVLL